MLGIEMVSGKNRIKLSLNSLRKFTPQEYNLRIPLTWRECNKRPSTENTVFSRIKQNRVASWTKRFPPHLVGDKLQTGISLPVLSEYFSRRFLKLWTGRLNKPQKPIIHLPSLFCDRFLSEWRKSFHLTFNHERHPLARSRLHHCFQKCQLIIRCITITDITPEIDFS